MTTATPSSNNSHSVVIGYILWVFGFMGAHRFYYGKRKSGILYFFTFGLFFIGWLVDLFLIPSMDEEADARFSEGRLDYTLAWILLTFTGFLGFHRLYLGKYITGVLFLLTSGAVIASGFFLLFLLPFVFLAILYDYVTLNHQIDEIHRLGL